MQHFGYEVLITILLPGLVLGAAVGVLAFEQNPAALAIANDLLDATPLATSTAVLVASAALGTVLAALMWVFELKVMDPYRAARENLEWHQYTRMWSVYVDSLRKEHNSHISRLVVFLYFNQRMGVAVGVLGCTFFVIGGKTMAAAALLGVGVAMLHDASRLHADLATYRRRHFDRLERCYGAPPSTPARLTWLESWFFKVGVRLDRRSPKRWALVYVGLVCLSGAGVSGLVAVRWMY